MTAAGVDALRVLTTGTLLVLACAAVPGIAAGQERLSLQQAVDEALRTRPSLKADTERVASAVGLRQQAGARANADFQFTNENLRRGQTYGRDVDTLAVLTQPIDVAGRRTARIAVADEHVTAATAEADLGRIALIRAVTAAYWEAREAQEVRDVLQASVEAFQQIVDYHAAQFRAGVIPEQDLLRVQLESERLKIGAGVGALDAARERATLLKTMGRAGGAVVLTEPLDGPGVLAPLSDDVVLAARGEVHIAMVAVAEAEAQVHLQDVLARPEMSGLFGFKRTQLPDAIDGVNTLTAGVRISVPWADRNAGNRIAASADVRRQRALLDAVRLDVLADYHAALDDYTMRRTQITDIVIPLRQHAANISQIAQAAYNQGGTDLLRLLDAKRAQLDAEIAWVHAMADWQQCLATLKFAGGEIK